jgi:hypothetical protein
LGRLLGRPVESGDRAAHAEIAQFSRILAASAEAGMETSVLGMLGDDSRPLADAFRISGMGEMGLEAAALAFRGSGRTVRSGDDLHWLGRRPSSFADGQPISRTAEKPGEVSIPSRPMTKETPISGGFASPVSENRNVPAGDEKGAGAPELAATRETDGSKVARVSPKTGEHAAESVTRALGFLSARFESASAGVSAIGYDRAGGTSYGTYQIASRPGTMSAFLGFLDRHAPPWAERLRAAGPANTGSRDGEMPRVWKAIAAESPAEFGALQHRFIRESHFEPARRRILERTGLDVGKSGRAVQEVVFSTAVQHGAAGAAGIVAEAADAAGGDESALIREIYAVRHARFATHQPDLAAVMARRYAAEAAAAGELSMGRG